MKLNILNYNPNLEEDISIVDNIINFFVDIKNNLNKREYPFYNLYINKISKFMNFINNNDKDIKEYKNEKNIFDEEEEDDDISIASISEYEEEQLSEDEILIEEFENFSENKFVCCDDRFDFEFINVFIF